MTGANGSKEDLDVLAGEYVLGLLDSTERARFEARLVDEPLLRSALKRARDRFLEIDTSARAVPPAADLWQRIEAGLGKTSNVVELTPRRKSQAEVAASRAAPRRPQAAFWQGFAAAAVLAVMVAGIAASALWPKSPRLIVVLLDAQARPVSIVETFEGQKIRVIPLGAIEVPKGKTLQVWTLPDRKTGPVSMGLMPSVSATRLEGPPLPAPKLEQLYEITLEPAGGSPTGKPTGPIIGKGLAKAPRT